MDVVKFFEPEVLVKEPKEVVKGGSLVEYP